MKTLLPNSKLWTLYQGTIVQWDYDIVTSPIFSTITWCERGGCRGPAGWRSAVMNLPERGPSCNKNLFHMGKVPPCWPFHPSVVTLKCLHCDLLRKPNKQVLFDSHDNSLEGTGVWMKSRGNYQLLIIQGKAKALQHCNKKGDVCSVGG